MSICSMNMRYSINRLSVLLLMPLCIFFVLPAALFSKAPEIPDEFVTVVKEAEARIDLTEEVVDKVLNILENDLSDLEALEFSSETLLRHSLELRQQIPLINDYSLSVQNLNQQLTDLVTPTKSKVSKLCDEVSKIILENDVKKGDELQLKIDEVAKELQNSHSDAASVISKAEKSVRGLQDFQNLMTSLDGELQFFYQKLIAVQNSVDEVSGSLHDLEPQVRVIETRVKTAESISAQITNSLSKDDPQSNENGKIVDSLMLNLKNKFALLNSNIGKIQTLLEKDQGKNQILKDRYNTIKDPFDKDVRPLTEGSYNESQALAIQMSLEIEDFKKYNDLLVKCRAQLTSRLLSEKEFRLPDFSKEKYSDASKRLEQLGIVVEKSIDVPAPEENMVDVVISQTPRSGAAVHPGSKVTLVVFGDYLPLVLPDFTGLKSEDALKHAAELHINVMKQDGPFADTPQKDDTVESQEPSSGTRVKSGTNVILFIYRSYEDAIVVPNLVGLAVDAAKEKLTDLKLGMDNRIGVVPPDKLLSQHIYFQDPAAGSRVAEGTVITTLAYKKLLLAVPKLEGLTIDEAEDAAQSIGLKLVEEAGNAPSSPLLDRVVYQQTPRPLTPISEGEEINVVYYSTSGNPLTQPPEIPPQKSSVDKEVYVVCTVFVSSSNETNAKKSEVDFEERQTPLVIGISGEALSLYPAAYFNFHERLAFPIEIKERSLQSGQTSELNGAVIFEVEKIFHSLRELQDYFPLQPLSLTEDPLTFIKITSADGTFHGSSIQNGLEVNWKGGPLERGWSARARKSSISLFKQLEQ